MTPPSARDRSGLPVTGIDSLDDLLNHFAALQGIMLDVGAENTIKELLWQLDRLLKLIWEREKRYFSYVWTADVVQGRFYLKLIEHINDPTGGLPS